MSTSFSKIKYNWKKNDKQEKENVRNVFCQIQRENISMSFIDSQLTVFVKCFSIG